MFGKKRVLSSTGMKCFSRSSIILIKYKNVNYYTWIDRKQNGTDSHLKPYSLHCVSVPSVTNSTIAVLIQAVFFKWTTFDISKTMNRTESFQWRTFYNYFSPRFKIRFQNLHFRVSTFNRPMATNFNIYYWNSYFIYLLRAFDITLKAYCLFGVVFKPNR